MKLVHGINNKARTNLIYLESRGEKITYFIRWLIIALHLFLVTPIYYKRFHNSPIYDISLNLTIFIVIIYNTYLSIILFGKKYKSYIKYISLFLDVIVLFIGIQIWTHKFATLYPVTGTSLYLYGLILVLASARVNTRFTALTTLTILIAFNIQYIIWIRELRDFPEFLFVATEGFSFQQQFLKSIYILIIGIALCYTNYLIKKFVINNTIATERAITAETRLVNQYKIILNNINTGICLLDDRGILLFLNKTLETLTGYGRREVIGKNIYEIVNKDKGFVDQIKKAVERKRSINFIINIKSKTNTLIPVSIFVTKTLFIRDIAYLVTVIDLTKQKALEERLIHARKMETVGRFASGFAHDFNNLISILEEHLYYASFENSDIKFNNLINEIKTVVDRQKELVELLYKISGKMDDGESELSVTSLFTKIITLLKPTIPDTIKLEIKSSIPENYRFIANETAIMQILLNLITNAKEAIEPGEGEIIISTTLSRNFDFKNAILTPKKTREQDFLIFTVSDNGPGIPKNLLKTIFEPYVSTKSSSQSFKRGLGLSFVYAIVEQLKGGIAVHTEIGKETTFTITIPVKIIKTEEEDISINTNPDYTGHQKLKNYANSPSILYIDDDEDMRIITSKILKKHGYTIISVESGQDALQLIKEKNGYDLIVTDYYLSDMDGSELIEKIKEEINIPIVLMTGAHDENIQRLNQEKKVAAVIKKPIEVENLIEVVKKTIERGIKI